MNNTPENILQENKETTVIGSPFEKSFYRSTPVRLYLLMLWIYMFYFWAIAMLAGFQRMDYIPNAIIAVWFIMPIPAIITSYHIGKRITTHSSKWLTIPFVYIVTTVSTLLTCGVGELLFKYNNIRPSWIIIYFFILPIPCAVFSFVGLLNGVIKAGGLTGMVGWLRYAVGKFTFWFALLSVWSTIDFLIFGDGAILSVVMRELNPVVAALPREVFNVFYDSFRVWGIRPLLELGVFACFVLLGLLIDIPLYFVRLLRKPERSKYRQWGMFACFSLLYIALFWVGMPSIVFMGVLTVAIPVCAGYLSFEVGKSGTNVLLRLLIVPLTVAVTLLCYSATILINLAAWWAYHDPTWDSWLIYYTDNLLLLLPVVVMSTVGVFCGIGGKEAFLGTLTKTIRTVTFWFVALTVIELAIATLNLQEVSYVTTSLNPLYRILLSYEVNSVLLYAVHIATMTVCGIIIDNIVAAIGRKIDSATSQ